MPIYRLCFTQDLLECCRSSDMADLIARASRSGYKMAILQGDSVVWQSSPSARFGNQGVT